MSQTINIIKLMEENPNTKLSKPYQGKLINKLKDNFSTEEQQLFITSFYCYLNYKSYEFVIDLDHIWKWLGFSQKIRAKELLEKNFKVEIDYKIISLRSEENVSIGRPSEKIMMNIKTFKKFCLKANTSKANEIHEYYIKLEETLHEVIDEESNELRLQLEMKEEIIQKKDEQLEKKDNKIKNLQRETQVVNGRNVCYLCTEEQEESKGNYIIGKATSLKKRLSDYNNNKLFNFRMVYYVSCKTIQVMNSVEKILLSILNKYKILSNRDVFQLPEGKDVSFFTQYFDIFKNLCDNIEEDLVLEERTTEELNELEKEIKEKPIKSSDEKKENKKEYMKIYRKENAEHITESKKRYTEEKKEIMEERIDCACGSTVTRQNMTYHLDTDRHKNYLETGKTVNESRKEEFVDCICGMSISKRGLKRHKGSKIHKSYVEAVNKSIEV